MKPASTGMDGTVVPLLTMFTKDYKIDLDAQILLTKHVLANGADVLFLCGSTGEGQWLQRERPAERAGLLEATKEAMDGVKRRIPVIFGIYGNDVPEIIAQYKEMLRMQEAGKAATIDGFVVSPPMKRKLADAELDSFFTGIIAAIKEPVFIYNNPATFGENNISVATYEAMIITFSHVHGIKDSSGSMDYRFDVLKMLEKHPEIAFYTGSEGDYFKCLEKRAPAASSKIGSIPSISNVLNIPARIRAAYLAGDVAGARKAQDDLNAIRNRIYHEPLTKGKAQRGTKHALACLYPGTALDKDVVVIPDHVKEMTPDARKAIKDAVDEALQHGFVMRFK
ncbi:MAG: dihydrodipicolinate synthase family protein [Candidatus Lokiarchaeota archaeon]|nr:dihydrodipicolinate synthase family protein [Candidatus Lokiarchaeota archaeon]